MNITHIIVVALIAAFPLAGAAQGAEKAAADLKKLAQRALETGKEDEALAHIQELGALKGEEALKALFELGLVPVQGLKTIKAIGGLLAARTDEEALKFFEAEARSPKELRQIYVIDILGEMKHARALEILGTLVEEKNLSLRRSLIAALARQRAKGSVEPLLKLLEILDSAKDRSQVYQEVRDALFEVTSQDFDALADWKKWWDVAKATFEPGKKPEGATQTRKASRDAAPEFGGKKIFGKNVVFVIDTSGTMQYVQKDDIPGLSRADGTDRAGGREEADEQLTRENQRLAKFWTRMEMAKRELVKALSAFDTRARVNILEFNNQVKKFEKALFPANPDMKKKALGWVKRMNWKENANTYTQLALEEAFATDKSTTEIYFLSDGIPSKDGVRNDPTEPILDKVEVLNRFRKIKIHTFGYDPVSITEGMEHGDLIKANEFLKKLARRTGGEFKLLKVTDEKPPKDFKSAPQRAAAGAPRSSAPAVGRPSD